MTESKCRRRPRGMRGIAVLCLAAAASTGGAVAQPALSLSGGSGSPGGTVNVNITFSSNGTRPTGSQWTLNYSAADFSSVTVAPSSTVSSLPGETLSCSPGAGSTTCLIINLTSTSTTIPDGTLGVATFQISPTTRSTSSQITLSGLSATDGNGRSLGLTGTGATVAINQVAALASLSCNPNSFTPPGNSTCTVALTSAATASSVVSLTSGSPMVTLPASVIIAAGATSATFTATAASSVKANTSVTLSASWNGVSQTATLNLTTPQDQQPGLSALSCNPAVLVGGEKINCTVTLRSPAPAGGTAVHLSSSSANLITPGQVIVLPGSTTASFTVTTQPVGITQSQTLAASANGTSTATTVTLQATGSSTSLVCAPATIQTPGSTTCTLTVTPPATASVTFALTSSSPGVSLPASVAISAGMSAVTFAVQAAAASSNSTVLVSVVGGGSQTLNLLPQLGGPLLLNGLACHPSILTGGGSSTCSVTLPAPASAPGVNVQLSASSSQIHLPPAVLVNAGAGTATFAVNSPVIDFNENAILGATLPGGSMQTSVGLVALKPLALSCSPKTVVAGTPVTCQVTLNSGSTTAPVLLALSSSDPHLTLPSTLSTAPGAASAPFQANTGTVTQQLAVVVSATFRGVAVQDSVTLVPAGPALKVPGPQSTQPGTPLNFGVSASDPSGLPLMVYAKNLPANAWFDTARGTFSWVPDVAQLGSYTVRFSATDFTGVTSSADVAIKIESSTPTVLSLENAASYANDGGCSPGSLVTLFGGGFTAAPGMVSHANPLPLVLNGVRVKANDVYLPVLYASEFQLNLQCPQTAPGSPVELVVETPTGSSRPLASAMLFATPGIFSLDGSGTGQGAILIANTGTVAMPATTGVPSQPVKAGGLISIYATGLGPVDANVPIGEAAPLNSLVKAKAPVSVMIGGVPTPAQFAGLAPGYVGLYQVNAQVPPETVPGSAVSVQLGVRRPDGTTALSNIVTIAVAAP